MELKGIGWLSWKRDSQTRAFLALLEADVAEIKDGWLNKSYVADSLYQSDTLNTAALASARALMDVIESIEAIQDQPEGENDAQ